MQRLFCNGCGNGPLMDRDVWVTEVRTSTLEGQRQQVGAKTDKLTRGVLCGPCVAVGHEFVAESKDSAAEQVALSVVAGA